MQNSYLVQRGQFREAKKDGINGLIQFDYMGSAEFEFGSLPKSLKRIREGKDVYEQNEMMINKKRIIIFSKRRDKKQVKEIISRHSRCEIRTKEGVYLEIALGLQKVPFREDSNFWWDIDNDFMFWIDDEEYTAFLIELLKNKRVSK